jgi:hypothetical protein
MDECIAALSLLVNYSQISSVNYTNMAGRGGFADGSVERVYII